MSATDGRYCFNLRYGYVWRAMFTKRYFWRMWGKRQTLSYLITDTMALNTRR